jgi:hypothetical protein
MPVATNSIVTAQGLKTGSAVCTTAKTVFTDSSNSVLLLTAGANGTVVYSVQGNARATVTATSCFLYRSKDGGTTLSLVKQVTLSAGTLSGTQTPTVVDFGYNETTPLRLAAGDTLYVAIGTSLASGIVFDATAEDL